MDIVWNISLLNNLLYTKDIYLSLIGNKDKYNTYISDKNALISILSNVEHVNIELDKYIGDVDEKYNKKKNININQITSIDDISNILIQNRDIKIGDVILLNRKKISPEKGIQIVNYSLTKNCMAQSRRFLYMIRNNYVHFDNTNNDRRAFTAHSISDSMQLIYIDYNKDLQSLCDLSHEFGHAYQYNIRHDINGNINIAASLFSEAYAILHQLLFIENVKHNFREKEIKKVMYNSISNYQMWCNEMDNEEYMKYAYSSLLAFYLFYLSQVNYQQFVKKVNLFNKLIYKKSDIEILKELRVSLIDLYNCFNSYVDQYNSRIK